nr:hypothetical protein [uncultured Dethiosulfovibrio sp.]
MTRDGRYIFDVGMLGEYHGKNLANFSDSLREGIDIVICDNTNLTPWHTTPYSEIARENGRFILLMTFEPRELHKHVESQIVTEERPDAHGVPEEVLVRFIEEYNLYDPLLYRENAPDPDLHRSFVWDEVSCRKIASDKLCQHFDYDALFVVKPDRYHSLKGTIGQNVFDLLYGFTKNQTKGELKR